MEDQLTELVSIVGIRGSFLCWSDGRILAQAMPSSVPVEQISILARLVAQTLYAIGVSGNRANEIDWQFQEGRLLLRNLRGAILVLYCDPVLNLPLVNLNVNRIVKKLNAEVKAREPLLTPRSDYPSPQATSSEPKAIPPPDKPGLNLHPVNTFPQEEGPLTKRLRQSSTPPNNGTGLPYYEMPTPSIQPVAGQEQEPEDIAVTGDLISEPEQTAASNLQDSAQPIGVYVPLAVPPELEKQDCEARRLIEQAAEKHLTLRALGTIAVHWHCHRAHAWLPVPDNYRTLDFCGLSAQRSQLIACLSGFGYHLNENATKLFGSSRLIFDAQGWRFRVQVYLDFFEMFQYLDFTRQLDQEPLALAPTLLWLTYLQKLDMSRVELQELSALCLDHPLQAGDNVSDKIDLLLLCQLFGNEWEWYKSAEVSLATLQREARTWLEPSEAKQLDEWIAQLTRAMQQAPKSMRWRLRAVAGQARPWHLQPNRMG